MLKKVSFAAADQQIALLNRRNMSYKIGMTTLTMKSTI